MTSADRYGCCGMPKSWSRNTHADFCIYGKRESMKRHPSAKLNPPQWYLDRYATDDHDLRCDELREPLRPLEAI